MPTWITPEEAGQLQDKAQEVRQSLHPLASVTAAAARLVRRDTRQQQRRTTTMPRANDWQEEAWQLYDLVGEFRFLANTLANRIGSGALYVGEVEPDKPTAEPVQSTNDRVQAVLSAFGGNHAGRAQIITRMALNLIVAGEGWLLGLDAAALNSALAQSVTTAPLGSPVRLPARPVRNTTNDPVQQEWRALSVSELTSPRGDDTIEATLEDETKITAKVDEVDLIRVWRPHGRKAWEADSAAKASLPTLRELVGLTMHVAAQVDSRLAGAGLLAVKQAVIRAHRLDTDDGVPDPDSNPLLEALLQYMMTPIQDRSSPSAVVPLILPVPDEVEQPLQYVTFASELDQYVGERREEAIRRFALSQDCPPEILLGTAAANHWGAWLVHEDTVTVHIEPPLALICDALTTQYLWPALIQSGMAEEEAQRFVVWYSVDHMVVRPNQFEEAKSLWEAGLIDDDTYRRAAGFDTSDAEGEGEGPEVPTDGTASEEQAKPVAIRKAWDMCTVHPTLAPDVISLARNFVKLLTGDLEAEIPPALQQPPPAGPDNDEEEPAGELPTEPTTDGPPAPEES